MAAYYNEIDPVAAEVLRTLIANNVIAPGVVDTRSIMDVQPDDLDGFTQCHFFAGAGLWSVAARLAGWPDDKPLWSGSCPCQPFSVAGKGAGFNDTRHLWPDFFRLIGSRRPPVVVGEQVAGQAGYGWLDRVLFDLADEDYAARGVDLTALAVDAPHIRQRIYWLAVADACGGGRAGRPEGAIRRQVERVATERPADRYWSDAEWIRCPDGKYRRTKPGLRVLVNELAERSDLWRLAGNSVVAELAAEVLRAYLETENSLG